MITLTEEQTRKLLAIEYLEGKPASEIIDEFLDNLRFVKTKYELNLSNIGVFSNFLKEANKSGLRAHEIINSMHILTRLGVARAKFSVFNLFVDIVKYFIRNKLKLTDLGSILKSKKEVFMEGYNKCIEDSVKIIINNLPTSVTPLDGFNIATRIQSDLLINLHQIELTLEKFS